MGRLIIESPVNPVKEREQQRRRRRAPDCQDEPLPERPPPEQRRRSQIEHQEQRRQGLRRAGRAAEHALRIPAFPHQKLARAVDSTPNFFMSGWLQ